MNYLLAITIAISAFTYAYILTQPKMILNSVYNFLYKKLVKETQSGSEIHWFFKILMYCPKCVSGQWALWIFLYLNLHKYSINSLQELVSVITEHLAFVLVTVFFTALITNIYQRHE